MRILIDSYLANRILAFLKRELPEKCKQADAELLQRIAICMKTARENGIRTERSIAKWSYLLFLTDGKLLRVEGVKSYLEQPRPPQSEKVDRLMKTIAVGSELMHA